MSCILPLDVLLLSYWRKTPLIFYDWFGWDWNDGNPSTRKYNLCVNIPRHHFHNCARPSLAQRVEGPFSKPWPCITSQNGAVLPIDSRCPAHLQYIEKPNGEDSGDQSAPNVIVMNRYHFREGTDVYDNPTESSAAESHNAA